MRENKEQNTNTVNNKTKTRIYNVPSIEQKTELNSPKGEQQQPEPALQKSPRKRKLRDPEKDGKTFLAPLLNFPTDFL